MIKHIVFNIIDSYGKFKKEYYSFCLSFSIGVLIVALIFSFLYCYLLMVLFGLNFQGDTFFDQLLSSHILYRFDDVTRDIIILSFGVSSIYLFNKKSVESGVLDNNDFIKTIPNALWSQFFLFILLVLVVNGVLFQDLFELSTNPDVLGNYYLDDSYKKHQFVKWLSNFIEVIKNVIPWILSALLILYYIHGSVNFKTIIKHKKSIFISLIFCLTIESVFLSVSNFIDTYLIHLISISINNFLIPLIFTFFIKVFLLCYFSISVMGALYFPFNRNSENTNFHIPQ